MASHSLAADIAIEHHQLIEPSFSVAIMAYYDTYVKQIVRAVGPKRLILLLVIVVVGYNIGLMIPTSVSSSSETSSLSDTDNGKVYEIVYETAPDSLTDLSSKEELEELNANVPVNAKDIKDQQSVIEKEEEEEEEEDEPENAKLLIYLHPSATKFVDFAPEDFRRCQGVAATCNFTRDESLYKRSDAVLFNGPEILTTHVGELRKAYRPKRQKWVWYSHQAPWHYDQEPIAFEEISDLFNVTAGYSRKADILHPYGDCMRTKPLEKQLTLDVSKDISNDVAVYQLASECSTQGKREVFVEELRRYIPVDVWGSCGKKPPCEPSQDLLACHSELAPKYKFFLAFENSLCDDYTSEQLWALYVVEKANVIPVVYGGARYEELPLPKDSYINVKDFTSAEALAQHLLYLAQHDSAFRKYFYYRDSYQCSLTTSASNFICPLCQYLVINKRNKETKDLQKYWGSQEKCYNPAHYFNMQFLH